MRGIELGGSCELEAPILAFALVHKLPVVGGFPPGPSDFSPSAVDLRQDSQVRLRAVFLAAWEQLDEHRPRRF